MAKRTRKRRRLGLPAITIGLTPVAAQLDKDFGRIDDGTRPQPPAPGEFERIGIEIGQLVTKKNEAYGDSFFKAGAFLQLLYPTGVQPHQYGNALAVVRIFDKMMRIATDQDAFGEDPFRDITGYGILGQAMKERNR